MMSHSTIVTLGLTKLAQDLGYENYYPESQRATPLSQVSMNPLHAPTQQEVKDLESYPRAGLLGALAGGATGTLFGALTKRKPLMFGGLGAGAGALSALLRHYDQRSDPPGLSPVYTIPSGLRLGALAGGGAGALLGKATGLGVLPGLLAGAGSGAAGGGIVSNMV